MISITQISLTAYSVGFSSTGSSFASTTGSSFASTTGSSFASTTGSSFASTTGSSFASTTGSSFASTTGSVGTSIFSVSGLPKSDFTSGSDKILLNIDSGVNLIPSLFFYFYHIRWSVDNSISN